MDGFLSRLISEAPKHPGAALVYFEDNITNEVLHSTPERRLEFYATFLERFAKKYDLTLKEKYDVEDDVVMSWKTRPGNVGTAKLQLIMSRIRANAAHLLSHEVEKELDVLLDNFDRIKNPAEEQFGYATLDLNEKNIIHEHLNTIRNIIEASIVTESKKNLLRKLLVELGQEVDLAGTRAGRFAAASWDFAFALKGAASVAQPVVDEFKEVLRIVFRARARTEGVELPSPEDIPQLPSKIFE